MSGKSEDAAVNETERQSVLFFVKAPEPGRVKTRLATSIGSEAAGELYRCFVEDLAAMLDALDVDVVCCYQASEEDAEFLQWLGRRFRLAAQHGDDLGERMKHAFREAFASGVRRAVLIGSDSPDLASEIVEQALTALQTSDAVIGPSSDGGYYLLGFRADRFVTEVFDGIRWSTEYVYDQTLGVLNKYGRRVALLPRWHDVDTRSDLDELIERNRDTKFLSSRTLSLVRSSGWGDPGKESTR